MSRKNSVDKEKYDELVKQLENFTNENKKQKSKKKKTIIALSITLPVLLISGVSTAIILTSSKTQKWTFNKEDYINLRQSIILSKLTLEQFKNNMLNFFKQNLKASNKSINNLVKDITIIEESEKTITFKVLLETKNNSYNCVENNKFYILNNELVIEYSGENFIKFPIN